MLKTENVTVATKKTEDLSDRAKRIGAMLKSSDTGPLIVAGEVMALAAEWASWQDEADGLSCDGWCKKALNRPLKFFRNRDDAVKAIGPEARRSFHHDVAKWLVRKKLPDATMKEAVTMILVATRKNGGHPLSVNVATTLVRPLIGWTPRGTVCAGCVMLEIKVEQLEEALALLRAGGVVVTENRGVTETAEN